MKPDTVFLGEMTNREVEEFLKTRHTVIIPTGSTEQHGPHAPLLTDVLIPQEVARRVAPQIGAVVAPPINYALSYPHVGFKGLVHIRIPTSFEAQRVNACHHEGAEVRTVEATVLQAFHGLAHRLIQLQNSARPLPPGLQGLGER